MKLDFTPSAEEEFVEAVEYIYQENPKAALVFHQKAGKILQRLKQFPESGRYLPEFPGLPYREVIVSPYRFFYRLSGNTVWVVALWHFSQDVKQPTDD
jgi:toxin ParE1/3/4